MSVEVATTGELTRALRVDKLIEKGQGTRNRTGRGAQARRGDVRKSRMLTQEEPQVELEGEC